jgi:hypothetical protein
MPQAPSGFNSALMIGNGLMSGLSTYAALKAPASGGSGGSSFNSKPNFSFPSAMSNNTNLAFSLPGRIY